MLQRNVVNYIAFFRHRIFLNSINKHQLLKFFKTYSSKATIFKPFPPLLSGLLIAKAISKNEKIVNPEKIIVEADNFYNEGKFDELFTFLNTYRQSDDPEILWRLARAIFETSRTLKEDHERLLNLEKALQFVNKALEINEQCWAAHKWRAILIDYVWRNKSTKGRIIHSFDVKKHMERAIELNPKDSTSYYLRGEWSYTFADMPWYQRQVASAIFASPPTSTYEEALEYFEKAEKISPMFYSMNLLMIGKCYLKLNDKEKAVKFLTQARDYEVKTSDDRKAHEEAEKILKGL